MNRATLLALVLARSAHAQPDERAPAILAVRAGDAQISIDAQPFVRVRGELIVRVAPGPHAIRVRGATDVLVFAFAGETKLVELGAVAAPPEPAAAAVVRAPEPPAAHAAIERISSGALVEARLDGNHGKGFALGIGVVLRATPALEVVLEGMKSDVYGVYVGARYVFRPQRFRPYVALGMPLFFFTDDADDDQIVVGLRAAAGLEAVINSHVAVQAELGFETYFNVDSILYKGDTFDRNQFAPSLGLIGRL